MRRALLILMLSACGWFVQPGSAQPTIVQQIFTNQATATATNPVNNVGQVGHQAYLQFSNAPAQTCSNPAATAQLEYSFDKLTWNSFGSPTTSYTVTTLSQPYTGGGGYNYIRFNLSAFDTTHCRATVWYTGTPGLSPFSGYPTTAVNCATGVQFTQPLALVPNALTVVTSIGTCVSEMVFNNSSGSPVTITVQDGNGLPLLSAFSIPSNSIMTIPLAGIRLSAGIKWQAGTASVLYGGIIGIQ